MKKFACAMNLASLYVFLFVYAFVLPLPLQLQQTLERLNEEFSRALMRAPESALTPDELVAKAGALMQVGVYKCCLYCISIACARTHARPKKSSSAAAAATVTSSAAAAAG